jgi:hypothetical protein
LLRLLSRTAGVLLLCVVAFFGGKRIGFNEAADRRRALPNGSVMCKPGPWGDLSYIPFSIAAPDDLLPVRSIEANGTHWFLKGCTADNLVTLLQSTSLTPEQQQEFLTPAVLHVQQDGVDLTPTADMVFSLPQDARSKIYQILAESVLDNVEINIIPKDTVTERFSASGVAPATVALFKKLCCERGNYLLFSGQAAMFARLPSYDEKLRFLRAITRQRTMLLRLHVTPESDVDALTRYWGKGCWNTDVRTLLQSFATISNGTWMNILMVLPPLPTEEIYDYPNITDNPLDGPLVNRDCHWSTFNFFRDTPDPDFGKPDYVLQELKENYYPVPGDPNYGDVVLFSKPDGTIIHSAVYIADDICFTKNGGGAIQPWMLSTTADLIEQYSILIGPDQKLSISYYRSKRL